MTVVHWNPAYIEICPIEALEKNRLIGCGKIDANTEESSVKTHLYIVERDKMVKDAPIKKLCLVV